MEGQRGTVDRVTGVQERLHRTDRNSVRREDELTEVCTWETK